MKRLFLIVAALITAASAHGSPSDTGARPLGFDEALSKIIERSTEVGTQREKLEVTRAKNLPNHLALLPTISVSATDTQLTRTTPLPRQKGIQGTLGLNIFHFGADVAAMRAANAEERAQSEPDPGGHRQNGGRRRPSVTRGHRDGTRAPGPQADIADPRRPDQNRARTVQAGPSGLPGGGQIIRRSRKRYVPAHRCPGSALNAQRELETLLGDSRIELEWPWKTRLPKEIPSVTARDAPDLSMRPDWKAAEQQVESAHEKSEADMGPNVAVARFQFNLRVFPAGSAPVAFRAHLRALSGLAPRQ